MLIGILPTAGKSTRLSGVPKFALPFANPTKGPRGDLIQGIPLIASHLNELLKVVDHCLVPTSVENLPHLKDYLKDPRITVQVFESSSLSETMIRACAPWTRSGNKFILRFPDSVYLPAIRMSEFMSMTAASDVVLGLWPFLESHRGKLGQVAVDQDGIVLAHEDKNPNCDYQYVWGFMSFSGEFLSLVHNNEDSLARALDSAISNPSFLVRGQVMSGRYFDLGTIDGIASYAAAVKEELNSLDTL